MSWSFLCYWCYRCWCCHSLICNTWYIINDLISIGCPIQTTHLCCLWTRFIDHDILIIMACLACHHLEAVIFFASVSFFLSFSQRVSSACYKSHERQTFRENGFQHRIYSSHDTFFVEHPFPHHTVTERWRCRASTNHSHLSLLAPLHSRFSQPGFIIISYHYHYHCITHIISFHLLYGLLLFNSVRE